MHAADDWDLFHDWEHEACPNLHIAQIGAEGSHPAPLTPSATATRLRRIGDLVENQMKFWNEFYDVVLEAHGDKNGDGICFMPRNALNAPMPANLATGGGQCTNVYSGGTYDLGPDDALLVELNVPVPPAYLGFHLSNLWGESLDYANHISSLNGFQTEPDRDGRLRYVITDVDPQVPNWLDTAGHSQGFLTVRWTYSAAPAELPTATVTVIGRDEDGDDLTSLVAVHHDAAKALIASANTKSPTRHEVLLLELIGNGRLYGELRDEFYEKCGSATGDGKKHAFARAFKRLSEGGQIRESSNCVFRLDDKE